MDPGTQRVLRVSALFPRAQDSGHGANMSFNLTADDDAFGANNYGTVLVVARQAVDVSLGWTTYSANFEGRNIRITGSLHSTGIEPATNVSVSFEVPEPMEVVAGTLSQGTCAIENLRKITCTRATLAPGAPADLTVDVRSSEPGTFIGRFSATATNDGLPDNNTVDTAIVVHPLSDVGINPIPAPPGYIIGRTYELTIQVFTGARPVPWADVYLPSFGDEIAIDAVTTTAGTCPIPPSGSIRCQMGALPANALVTITMSLRPLIAKGLANDYVILAQTGIDPNHDNDVVRVHISTHVPGDVSASVAQESIAGTNGSLLALPRITVNTLQHGDGIFVEIPIPTFASIETVTSPSGICLGTTLLTCHFSARDAGGADFVDVTLRLNAAGTYISNIRAGALNDVNAANDVVALTIGSNAAPPPPATQFWRWRHGWWWRRWQP